MSQLTLDTHVIITRYVGRYYIPADKAEKLIQMLNSPQCPKIIEIEQSGADSAFVATSDIVGVITAGQLEINERERRGDWRCAQQNWHGKMEQCKCGWGSADLKKSEEEKKDAEMTPEQKRRSELMGILRRKGMTMAEYFKRYRKYDNDELEILVATWDEQMNKATSITLPDDM